MQAYERVGYTPTDEQRAKAEGARRKGPIRHERREPQSTEDMLRQLRALFAKHGYLTADLIDLQPQMRAANYTARFGGLRRAYALVGYEANRLQERVMDQNRSQDIDRDEARRIRQSLGHP
jgi:hypothetical protein